ncbi:MAG: aldehyde dehydrogenase family protein [Fimbriimonadaceae bacterium]|nr:aldehyde dehydrogenase family protein [Fimbriimonadaceae bacterium]QYK57818.1 MAG: aldehyde dehydrogenase family protein [Fimbriimonadaceae bacterium]
MPNPEPVLGQFIGGEFRDSSVDGRLASWNPSRPEEVVARAPIGSGEDVDLAVGAASAAVSGWSGETGAARAEALARWAERIEARAEEAALLMAREVGKPLAEAKGEAARCAAILRYFAGEAVRGNGQVIPAQIPSTLQFTWRKPLGVVGLVTPWNFPMAIPLWKAAPALAFGNTVVLKPSELSSACAQFLAETSAGLPSGVFNVVHGQGDTSGQALVGHEGVRGISFTGSVPVGTLVSHSCTARGARCQAEMGGKNAAVVLADADLPRAASLVAGGAFRFAGQKCTATSRVVVEAPVLPAFLEELQKAVEALPIGPVTDPANAIGPVATSEACERLTSVVEDSSEERFYLDARRGEGWFVPPAVFTGVRPGSILAEEELFGPVLAVMGAKDFDEALGLANRTRFGLSTSVFTRDLGRALAFAERAECGMVRVNGDTTGVDPHAPFGGTKSSSFGPREQGPAAREFFTEERTVQMSG